MHPYRPSIKFAVMFARLCLVAIPVLMVAWHDGHAHGEKRGRENGGALIFILIAVALFAGLTAAINQGSRTSTGMLSDQQARLIATEIVQYGNSVKQTVQKLLLQGCSESEISFENDIAEGYAYPDGSPDQCKVFHPQGGGMPYQIPPAPYNIADPGGWYVGRYVFIYGTTWAGQGTTCTQAKCSDLIMLLHMSDEAVCHEINKLLGYQETPTDTTFGGGRYQGSFYHGSMLADEPGGTEAEGRESACFYRTDPSLLDYVYAQVLIAR